MIGPPALVDCGADRFRSVMARLQPGSQTPTDNPDSSLDLVGDHDGLVVIRVARAEDESDRAPNRPFGESVERLSTIGLSELRPVTRLELRPTRRVVSEPRAEFQARYRTELAE